MATYDVAALSSALEYDTTDGQYPSITQLSSTRFLVIWSRSGTLKGQCFDINRGTGVISAVGTSSLTGFSVLVGFSVVAVDENNAVLFFADASDGYAIVISIDSSGNITNGTEQAFSTNNNIGWTDCVKLDATHVLYTFNDNTSGGTARVLSVNTAANTVSFLGSNFVYDSDTGVMGASLSLIDSGHALVTYQGTAVDGFARVLAIDGSFNVTGAAVSFEFYDSATIAYTNAAILNPSSSPILAATLYEASAGATTGRILQGLKIDSSAYTITNFAGTVRNQLDSYTTAGLIRRALFRIDNDHMIAFYEFTGADGRVQTLSINTSTGATTSLSTATFETTQAKEISAADLGSGLFVAAWRGASDDGFIQAFQVTMPATTSIKTINGLATASVKQVNGLAIASVKNWNGLA